MAIFDRTTRRADEAERTRQASATEAAAFATTAATMLLGLIAGAEAAQEQRPHPPEPVPPAPLPAEPQRGADQPPNGTDGLSHQPQHANATLQASPEPGVIAHAHDASASTTGQDNPGHDSPIATHAVTSEPHAGSSATPLTLSGEHLSATGDVAPAATAPAPLPNLGGDLHQITSPVTALLDTSLHLVTQTVSAVTGTLQQLTSSLTGDVTHLAGTLADTLTDLTGGVTHALTSVPSAAAGTLVSGVFAPGAPDLSATAQHEASLLDTAGTVPVSFDHAPLLQLGFIGQPTIDGHDQHDGAFSALGVHHF